MTSPEKPRSSLDETSASRREPSIPETPPDQILDELINHSFRYVHSGGGLPEEQHIVNSDMPEDEKRRLLKEFHARRVNDERTGAAMPPADRSPEEKEHPASEPESSPTPREQYEALVADTSYFPPHLARGDMREAFNYGEHGIVEQYFLENILPRKLESIVRYHPDEVADCTRLLTQAYYLGAKEITSRYQDRSYPNIHEGPAPDSTVSDRAPEVPPETDALSAPADESTNAPEGSALVRREPLSPDDLFQILRKRTQNANPNPYLDRVYAGEELDMSSAQIEETFTPEQQNTLTEVYHLGRAARERTSADVVQPRTETPPPAPELTREERELLSSSGGTGYYDLDQKLIALIRTATDEQRAKIATAFGNGVFEDTVDISNRDDEDTAEKMRQAYAIGKESTARDSYRRPVLENHPTTIDTPIRSEAELTRPQTEHEHTSQSETPPTTAENSELEILLQSATNEQERNLMRQAYRMGAENISYAGNNPEEASAFWGGDEVTTLINTHGREVLTRLYQAFYVGGKWRSRVQEEVNRPKETAPPQQTEAPPSPAPEISELPDNSFAEPATAPVRETIPPITEPVLTETAPAAESPPSSEEKEQLVVTLGELTKILVSQLEGQATINNLELQEDAGKLQLHAELNAGLLGGEISIRGTIVNRGNEIAVDTLAIQARGYVKTRIENSLSRFFPTIKTHFENKYGKSISSIQIVNYGLELTFETSPNATPEPPMVESQPVVAGGEAQQSAPEAKTADESQEVENTALKEAGQRLNEARTEYVQASFILEKGEESVKELRGIEEETTGYKFPSRLAQIRISEGEEKLRQKYLAAVQEIRKLRGEQVRDEMNRKHNPDANTNSRTTYTKEMGDRMRTVMEEISIREHIALYDEKTRLTLTPEHGYINAAGAWKFVQKCAELYDRADAYHRDPTKGRLSWANLPRNKIMLSVGLFSASLGAGFAGLTAAGVIVGGMKTLQRGLGGAATGVAMDASIHRWFERRHEKSVLKDLEYIPADLANLANNMDEILDQVNTDLDDRLLESVARRISRRNLESGISRAAGIATGVAIGEGYAARAVRGGLAYASELTGITPASIAEKLGASKDMIAKLIPRRGIAEAVPTQQAGATGAPPAGGAAPKELSFLERLGRVVRGSFGDEVSEPQKPAAKPSTTKDASAPANNAMSPQETIPVPKTPEDIQKQIDDLIAYHNENYDLSTKMSDPTEKSILAEDRVRLRKQISALQEKLESAKPVNESSAPASAPMPPASTTAEPSAKSREPSAPPSPEKSSPTPRTEPAPDAAASTKKPSAATATPKTTTEVAARARATELATVGKGEGAWQAVRRQFYERIKAEPTQYGITAEEAQKLPELDKLGKGTRVAKILNRETLATLKNAGYINEDGTTKLGMRPDARVILSPDNKISLEYEGKGKPTYAFREQKSGGVQAPDKAQGSRSMTSRPYPDYIAPKGTPELIAADDAPHVISHEDHRTSPAGQAAAEAAAVKKIESANLRATHLTKSEYRPIVQMRGDTFIKELDRHATEINEYRVHGGRKPDIFINRGALTTRGFRVELPQAEKYLDLSERLKKHLKTLRTPERTRLLKQPIGELLRTLPLTKNK